MLGVLIQLPQHLLPQWLLCVKSLAMALHCFFLEQASEGIFSTAELTKVMGRGGRRQEGTGGTRVSWAQGGGEGLPLCLGFPPPSAPPGA